MSNFNTTRGSGASPKVTYAKLVSGVPFVCRIHGDILRSYSYWLTSAAGKKAKFENLSFSREDESFTSGVPDPIREAGITELNSYTKSVEPIKSKRTYMVQVINRATNTLEVLDLKTSIFNDIIQYMRDMDVERVEDLELVINKTGVKWNEVKYGLNIIATQKANKDPEAVKALHEKDQEILKDAPSIFDLFPLETYEKQKKRLQTFLAAAPEAPEGEPDGEGAESLSDLDD